MRTIDMLKQLVCVAQARLIAGRNTKPHICSIALDQEENKLLRVCLPYGSSFHMPVRRWSVFTAELEKQSRDTRIESYFINGSIQICEKGKGTPGLHRQLLNLAVPEAQLIDENRTIGVKKIDSLKLHFLSLDERNNNIKNVMSDEYDLSYIRKVIRVSGVDSLTKEKYGRLLLDWQLYETMRKQRNIEELSVTIKNLRKTIEKYKHPYFITGTTRRRRKHFMSISVLSSPKPYV